MSGIRRSDEEDVSYEFDNEESEDESEILEESPCGRYLKRREQVRFRLNLHAYVRLI